MANVDTIFVLSNPTKTARLYYITKPFLDAELRSSRKSLNKILRKSKEKEKIGEKTLHKYYEYMKFLFENIDKLREKRVIFLNGISPDLMSAGIPGRSGCDPFSHLYAISDDVIQIANEIFDAEKSDEKKERIKNYFREKFVFWPIAPIDFPFYVDGLKIKHVFAEEVATLSAKFEEEGKVGFGSLEKRKDDIEEKVGNYEFREWLFDSTLLRKVLEDNPTMFVKERSKENLERWISDCISFNRWIMVEKYKKILKRLGLNVVSVYAIKTSYATEIFEKVCKETGVQLDLILRSKKGITPLRERSPTYLGQLRGRLISWIYDDLQILIKPHVFVKKAGIGKEIKFVSCFEYPFFRCEHGAECNAADHCTAHFAKQFVPKDKLALLAEDARRYCYSMIPIEGVVYLQNVREFEEIVDARRSSTIKERDVRFGRRKFVPFCPSSSPQIGNYDLRASEFGIECAISRVFNKIDKTYFPVPLDTKLADVGIALHWLSNQQPKEWNKFVHNALLQHIGVEPIPRWKYCEREIVYEFEGIKIIGHPDCILLLEGEQRDVAIVELKHGMHTPYEKAGYFDQTLIYALAVDQMEGIGAVSYYTMIVKTPFDPTRYAPTPTIPADAYRMPRYSKRVVRKGSKEIDELHRKILAMAKKEQILLNDKKALFAERTEMEEAGLCEMKWKKCFDKPLCDFILKQAQTSNLIDVLPKPYPAKIHRTELFK